MNYKMMGRLNSLILAIEAVFMMPALFISVYYGEDSSTRAFIVTIGIILALSGVLALCSLNAKRDFYAREGLICVGSSWILMSLLGCIPFVLSGAIPNYIDALFEMVSGFTTTGSSVIADLDIIPRGIIYWRSFSHWIGGMGVLVFLLAIVPVGGKNEGFTMHILRAESPGPDVGKLVPKMKQTATVLYITYIVLSALCLIFLLFDLPVFDAFCVMFGTAGTGGFTVSSTCIVGYSPYIQWVITIFMLLFGINFSCYYLLMIRKFRSVFRDEELRLYIGIVVASIVLISVNIFSKFANTMSLSDTVRHSAFQVASIITTTGYTTTDFNLWPSFSKSIITLLMLIGACAGSTGGGFKCARLLILIKSFRRNISQILRPQKVKVIRVNDKVVDEKLVSNTASYLFVYVLIMVLSVLVVSLDGLSFETNLSAVFSCFNNIGPGFDSVGPMSNFSCYGPISKLVLIFNMLAGRLEIFPILLLFKPGAWKRG